MYITLFNFFHLPIINTFGFEFFNIKNAYGLILIITL